MNDSTTIFGKKIKHLGKAVKSIQEFFDIIDDELPESDGYCYFYRGETQDYGKTAILPQLFRKPEWVANEHNMINEFVAKFPNDFPKGTSTFDIIINADHFGLPSRVLDISYSAFTGIFMACYNFSSSSQVDATKDGFVYIFKVPKKDIKNWNSDSVTLLSNLARMSSEFPFNNNWMKSINVLMHTIKDERPDFYKMHGDHEIYKYKKDFNKIVCVESKMLNPRITNQKGLFFLFGINGKKSNFSKMEFGNGVEIFAIKINGNHKERILAQLAMCGCDMMTMFPDMGNVCKNIKDNY